MIAGILYSVPQLKEGDEMPRKLKIYLDTSVISHLEQPGKPSEFEYTHLFWHDINDFDVYISEIVLEELNRCEECKRTKLLSYIAETDATLIEKDENVYEFADLLVRRKVLPPQSLSDSRHIAYAVFAECDYLLTWNMKHLANVYTNVGVRQLTYDLLRKPLQIIPPSMLIKKEEGDDVDT
jgi:predicted nucleic acid-binding protein